MGNTSSTNKKGDHVQEVVEKKEEEEQPKKEEKQRRFEKRKESKQDKNTTQLDEDGIVEQAYPTGDISPIQLLSQILLIRIFSFLTASEKCIAGM